MSRILNSTKLIASVRKRAMLPNDTSTYTDQDILDILNEELDIGMLPKLLSLNEEHLVNHEEIPTDGSKVRFPIPYRSIGNKLRDVALVDTSGGVHELSRISLEEISDYSYYYDGLADTSLFYIENNEVVLVSSTVGSYESVRMYFYLRPNVIVLEKETAIIDLIDRTTGTVVLRTFPKTFSSTPEMDFIGARTPNKTFAYDKAPMSVNVNAKTVVFNPSDIPASLSVGDYLCLRETTPVPQIPTEMHPVLAQRAAIHMLEGLGDTEGLRNAMNRLDRMDMDTMSLVDDRCEGSPQKINQRHSPLKQTFGFRNRIKG